VVPSLLVLSEMVDHLLLGIRMVRGLPKPTSAAVDEAANVIENVDIGPIFTESSERHASTFLSLRLTRHTSETAR
jgi:hypothetical protein